MIAGFIKLLAATLIIVLLLLAGSIWFDDEDWRKDNKDERM